MSEHTVSERPTPMEAIKQIYELFQTRENFTTIVWARDYQGGEVTPNDRDACCWCLSGAVFHVYIMDANIIYQSCCPLGELPENLKDTFMLLWEKLPANAKIGVLYSSLYISGIARFNDMYGYTGVMRLLQAVIDDTEYVEDV